MTTALSAARDRFNTMNDTTRAKILVYAKRLHRDFCNDEVYRDWVENRNDKNWVRSITRPFYDLVHSCNVPTGLITESAFQRRVEKLSTTNDHCYRPQFVYMFMMDNRQKFLDLDVFTDWVILCCSTITVTDTDNRKLSVQGTDNRHSDYKILSPTNKQYQHAEIDLFRYSDDHFWKNKSITQVSNLIDTPQELLEYEQLFMDTWDI
jgi:hypothetical protein